jgi:hypothetical protein
MKRITVAAVIAAPALFLVVNIIHPKEYSRDHEAQQLQTIADNYTRWQLAHFLTFVSLLMFVFAICGIALLLLRRRRTHALLGGALGLCGLVALGGVLALDGFTWGALGQVTSWRSVDRHSIVLALHAVQQSHYNLPFYVGGLSWLIGLVILSVGLIRAGLVPAWAGWTFAAGAALVGIEAAIANNVYFVIAAFVLTVGGVAVGTAIARIDDQEFA